MKCEENDSEMDEDLPSYGFPSSQPKDEQKTEGNFISSADVLASRKIKQELFSKVESICNSMQSMNTNTEPSTNDFLENDEETKLVLKDAEELKVQSTTLYYIPDHEFLKPELCGVLFNHETLQLKYFMGDCYSTLHNKLRNKENFEDLVRSTGLQVIPYPKNVNERLCCYLFYLMSVHTDFDLVFGCYSYLIAQKDYKPSFSDIINVLCNWGASSSDMFRTVPSNYQGLHPALLGSDPVAPAQIQMYNMQLLLKYLNFIVKTKSPTSYTDLLGPMLLFSVNSSTYLSRIKISVCEIVQLLANKKDCNYSLENLHQINLSLQNQFFLCSKSLSCTVLQLPIAYATLQQFLGESVINYTRDVDLESVFNLILREKNNVVRETFNGTSYILKLIDLLVRRTARALRNETTLKYVEKWLSLLGDLSWDIQESDRLSDPVLLKEQIAQMSYNLRIDHPELQSLCVMSVDMMDM